MGLLFGVVAAGTVKDFTLADLMEVTFKDISNIRPTRDQMQAEIKRMDPSILTPKKN